MAVTNALFAALRGVACALLFASIAPAQGSTPGTLPGLADPLSVKTIAEVESKVMEGGREVVRLVPADRVAPGDRVIYTLEVRNVGPTAVPAPTVSNPIPEHMRYVADSAVGPGAEVAYSVDGGHTFDQAENLTVQGAGGRMRPAIAGDYTHIRWQLKNTLKANSVAFVRFRAVVQ